MSYPRRHVD